MTSLNRVLTALNHKEPDQVPLCLLLSTYGAKEANRSIKDYFSDPVCVAETQIKMMQKYKNDFLNNFYYAAVETEAFGGKTIYYDNSAPNSGGAVIRDKADINSLKIPDISNSGMIQKVLKSTRLMKEKVGGEVPIVGVVISPFSLPTIQMDFYKYIELIYEEEVLFNKLMGINEEFCVTWANAQLEAGATAICYFDPMSSSSMTPRNIYKQRSQSLAKRVFSRIKGPVITHFASGNCLPVLDDVLDTGTVAVATSTFEDIGLIKEKCRGKASVIGNLNGVEMRNWSAGDVDRIIKDLISKAAPGGGYIISDNHGEIPYIVPEEVLLNISKAVSKFGKYPIR